uniref:ATP-dependent RNA helicase DHX34 n=1 Tax=Macrostomum lignano TaxID=282301 RepID=A0A1I8GDQ1_9PLAT
MSSSHLFLDTDRHRRLLDRLFFTGDNLPIVAGSNKAYKDFWAFYERYKRFKCRSGGSDVSLPVSSDGAAVSGDIGGQYDAAKKLNFRIKNRRLGDYIRHRRDSPLKSTDATDEQLYYFEFVLHLYLDFMQKQKLSKILQLRRSREALPVFKHKAEIIAALQQHQSVLVAGDTGCGKSTQVPQYLLEAGYQLIAVTQPRRLACIALAARVSYETLNEYGSLIGHQVRFDKARSSSTRVVFLTEGLLLRQMQADPQLKQYNVIVLDEVHERHLHTDFLLGLLKCLLRVRSDVKLVLMSATINLHLFASFLGGDVPVVRVPGRLHPIQLEYWPVRDSELTGKSEALDPGPYVRVLQERGDLLIFVAGMRDIVAVSEAAKAYDEGRRWLVLPLHGSLSAEEQDRVFHMAPEGMRKCIVSTNIAETSVTIDGVRFVADSGRVKELSWDASSRMQRLQQFWISKASAEQRKGRAGRTGPGVAFRLYSEQDLAAMQEYSTPELLRVPLDSLLLQLIAMGLPDVRRFPFVESPDTSRLEESLTSLASHGAVNAADETLTPLGALLARLPVDIVLGKMLVTAAAIGVADAALTMAALLAVQSPLTNRAHSDREAADARSSLESDEGGAFTLLNLYDAWLAEKLAGRDSRRWCRRRGIEEQRLYEAAKLRRQFGRLLQDCGLVDRDDWDEAGREDSKKEGATTDHRSDGARLSEDRNQRRRLAALKRESRTGRQRRRVLRLDALELGDDDKGDGNDSGDIGSDIRDLEFRLSHDLDRLAERRRLTGREAGLVKAVLLAGLHPQLAVPDSANSSRSGEMVFHTAAHRLVLLHPYDPLTTGGWRPDQGQLVAYLGILETTKPYLVHPLPVPGLPALLLFATRIHGNASGTRLLCDGWLELRPSSADVAESALAAAVALRSRLGNRLSILTDDSADCEESSLNTDNLEDSHASYLERLWLCRVCQQEFVLNLAGRLAHQTDCRRSASDDAAQHDKDLEDELLQQKQQKQSEQQQRKSVCPRCRCRFGGSTAEILRHRRDCHGS